MINNRPLINLVMQVGNFKNHSQMADELKISRVSISRIYHNAQNVSAETILAVHEYLGIPVYEIREVLQSRSIEETKMPKVNAEVREDYLSLMNAGVAYVLCNQVDEVIDYLVESGKVVREKALTDALLIVLADDVDIEQALNAPKTSVRKRAEIINVILKKFKQVQS